jgi:uncharacterized RmlC-like cupin family protein
VGVVSRARRSDLEDLTGRQFGSWTVLAHANCSRHGVTRWLCRCVCGVEKPVYRWSLVDGLSTSCGCQRPVGSQWTIEQHRASKKKYRDVTPGYRSAESKRWRARNPERARLYHRQTSYRIRYGIELAAVEQMLREQGGVCAICLQPVTLGGKAGAKLDHDHATNTVRGVLCSRCNTALGTFREDVLILAAAIAYLAKHQKVSG